MGGSNSDPDQAVRPASTARAPRRPLLISVGSTTLRAATLMGRQREEGDPTMNKLVLLRHGESTWNLENRFTGWTDVDLSPRA